MCKGPGAPSSRVLRSRRDTNKQTNQPTNKETKQTILMSAVLCVTNQEQALERMNTAAVEHRQKGNEIARTFQDGLNARERELLWTTDCLKLSRKHAACSIHEDMQQPPRSTETNNKQTKKQTNTQTSTETNFHPQSFPSAFWRRNRSA